ncbi:DAK2 domain-containing protein [Mycoplasma sp. 4423]
MSKILLDSKTFLQGMLSGSNALVNAKNRIDALNVFPVPDGDTGTNMSSTISAAIAKLDESYFNLPISEVTKQLALNMMYEARGNSGVILSQVFKGFSLACAGLASLDLKQLLIAFQEATNRAYKSVFNPTEGTMLTVIRETSENLNQEFLKATEVSLLDFWTKVLDFSRKSCDETPNKLKTLREVGVTDSGGEGLYIIFKGFFEYLKGNPVEKSENGDDISVLVSDSEIYSGEFGYCTEVLVDLNNPHSFDKNIFSKQIEEIANSLVIVNDDKLLKVHGHTVKPGEFLTLAQKYGEFIKIKSENMTLQANNSKSIYAKTSDEMAECGLVSCNLGSGIIKRMQELGTDFVVESGQIQNPSAQDLINAVAKVNAKNVFILPNNSNVILVAQQAAQVVTDKNIIVIPTKSQIQGLTAVLNFNSEFSAKENEELMLDSLSDVQTGEITKSVRKTKINNIVIRKGDYLGIHDGKIIASERDLTITFKKLITKMVKKQSQMITLYYGDDVDTATLLELSNYLEANYNLQIEVVEGNQPNYQFLIGVE